jgi:ubiquinone/menaquinone biosynthesis C-methylase UbiE
MMEPRWKQSQQADESIIASYDRLFRSPGRLRESEGFYRWVLDQLSARAGKRLLDVACGEGYMVKVGQERGLQALGIDLSPVAIRQAKRVAGQDKFALAAGERLPFAAGWFDYVTNLGSLEHFCDPLAGVQEMARVLSRSGYAALLLPNSYYLIDIIWHVLRAGEPPSHGQVIERFATCKEWERLINRGGLKVVKRLKYNFHFPSTRADLMWYRERPKKLINLILSPFIPFNLSYSFLFICCHPGHEQDKAGHSSN